MNCHGSKSDIFEEGDTMIFKKAAATLLTKRVVHYLEHDPEKNFDKIIATGRKLVKGRDPFYSRSLEMFNNFWNDKTGPWRSFFIKYLNWLDPKQREKFAVNFLVNNGVIGYSKQVEESKKLGCNVPWAILMDPTSACNLKCTGCWAAEYEKKNNLTYEEMEDVVRQGKKLNTYFYIFSGGEPLMRKNDIIKLCKAHQDCIFSAFTNGTLIDEQFADEIKQVGNFYPAISIEGFEKETDMRRGEGTFAKVVKAMDILKSKHLAFGYSCCYHSKNTENVASDEFIDFMIEKGAWFGWYFTFIPVGKDAPMELMVSPEQRAYMFKRINQIRSTKPIFVLDFWNDGKYVEGCIAGGRRYFHINSSGDAEPCAFIHYSTCNIRNTKLLDILKSPLFMAYHNGQPFNKNYLRPCPLLDNPECLRKMVTETGAKSTQPLDSENVNDLTDKCVDASKAWAPVADELWECAYCGKCSGHAEDKDHFVSAQKEEVKSK